MTGRDPHESGRVANTLELLFDLTFVIAFAQAASGLASAIHHHNTGLGLIGFAFATFAVVWPWINYSWFTSAFDTDDWYFRVLTMLQMVGVVIFAVSLPAMFASLTPHGDDPIVPNIFGMVMGYVVMRIAMVLQWLRVAIQDPDNRPAAIRYIVTLSVAQIGWIYLAIAPLELVPTLLMMLPLFVIELLGPILAERKCRTPWHPHHIAERYGLLVIITLGEVVVGTQISVTALLEEHGWSLEIFVLAVAGILIAFGLWWLWFLLPHGESLHANPRHAFWWGYGHIIIFGALAAIGAGLHVAAYAIEDPESVSAVTALAWTAGPIAIALIGFGIIRLLLVGWTHSRASFPLALTTVALLVLAVVLGAVGVPLSVGLSLIAVAPALQIVGDELFGHRARQRAVERMG